MKAYLLSPHRYVEGPDYRFTLTDDLSTRVEGHDFGEHAFVDPNGIVRGHVDRDIICARKNYATDGCSPKGRVFGFWIGTPDFKWTRVPSTIHDLLTQYLHVPCNPINRQLTDRIFLALMLSEIVRLKVPRPAIAKATAHIYYNAVRTAGVPFYHYGSLKQKRTGSCLFHPKDQDV
jgi:hypothetical protein